MELVWRIDPRTGSLRRSLGSSTERRERQSLKHPGPRRSACSSSDHDRGLTPCAAATCSCSSGVPARERSSEASLHQRLRMVLDENQALRDENRQLKHELALAYGERRDPAAITSVGAGSGSALGGASR